MVTFSDIDYSDTGLTAEGELSNVAIMGAPIDISVSRSGQRDGPDAIRRATTWQDHDWYSVDHGVNLHDVKVVDVGDAHIPTGNLDQAMLNIETLAASVRPNTEALLTLGGDHCAALAVLRALSDIHGPLHVVSFDAHLDLYWREEDEPTNHGTWLRDALDEELVRSATVVGARGLQAPMRDYRASCGVPVDVCWMHEVGRFAPPTMQPEDALYVTVDLDVLDPSVAPGVAVPEPGGLSFFDLTWWLTRLVQLPQFVGGDIVEHVPSRDVNNHTALVASRLVTSMLAGVALRLRDERAASEPMCSTSTRREGEQTASSSGLASTV